MTTKYLDSNGLTYLLAALRPSTAPADLGTAAAGSSKQFAKADHVHKIPTASDLGLANVATSGSYNDLSNKPTITTYSDFTGATASVAGTHGLVPAPSSGEGAYYLMGNGDWADISLSMGTSSNGLVLSLHSTERGEEFSNVLIPFATASNAGLMTISDYTKLAGLPSSVDTTVASGSSNLVTSGAVATAIAQSVSGAVAYQGTVPISGQTGGFAPTNYTAGWYWIVQTAGTYAGQVCEAGDMIFCRTSASTYSAANFDVIQTNLDITSITNSEIDTVVAA